MTAGEVIDCLSSPRKFRRGGLIVKTAQSQAEMEPLTEMKPNIRKSPRSELAGA